MQQAWREQLMPDQAPPAFDPDEPFFLTYGDGVGNVDITKSIALHRQEGRLATVTGVQPPGRFGALWIEGNQVKGFREKPDGDGASINGGYFVCSPKIADYLGDDSTVWEQGPLEGLARDQQLSIYRHDGFWQPMDTLRDKNYLDQLWQSGKAPWKTW